MNVIIEELEGIARKVRQNIIKMIGTNKTGHLGGGCSIVEMLVALYFYKIRHDPKDPMMKERDRVVLSKGHAAIAHYATLAEAGYFPKEEINNFKKLGCILQGHPDIKVPGVEANTGSLGQGLSIACGIAAGLKMDKIDARVYCIMGDGEVAEGQIWEAAVTASFYKLDNLRGIIDKNGFQASGRIEECFNTNPLREKWEAFGWHVLEVDGHDIRQIIEVLDKADEVKGKPVLIIAHTVKGKGISFAENKATFHHAKLEEEEYAIALKELNE